MYEKFLNYFTDYIFVKDEPQKADVIFVPGNGYPQMAAHAAELWKEGFAPYVLPSGRYSTVLGHFAGVQDLAEQYGGNYETEWEFLRTVLQKNGVPEKAILREDKATYTYENALRSMRNFPERVLRADLDLLFKRFFLLHWNPAFRSYLMKPDFVMM